VKGFCILSPSLLIRFCHCDGVFKLFFVDNGVAQFGFVEVGVFQGGTSEVYAFEVCRIKNVVDRARHFLQADRFPDVGHIPEVFPLTPGESLETETFRLETCATVHAVQGLCYRFTDQTTGSTFGFTGDTAYHPPIAEHLKGCPFIIHEASHGASQPENAQQTGHASATEAARIAHQAGAEQLALVHMRIETAEEAVKAAQEIFPNTFWPQDGQSLSI